MERVSDHPCQQRTDWVQLEREVCDNAKIAATTTNSPEEVRVLIGARSQNTSIGSDELHGQQVIDREAVFTHQPAHAPTQSEACQPGSRDVADRSCQTEGLGFAHKFANRETWLGPGDTLHWIDLDTFHRGEIDDDASVAGAIPREAVASTTNGDGKLLSACELDSRDDIGNIGAAGDQGGIFINHTIPDPAGALVAVVAWADQITMKMGLEILKGLNFYCSVKRLIYVTPHSCSCTKKLVLEPV
jgi:hypothetical protein